MQNDQCPAPSRAWLGCGCACVAHPIHDEVRGAEQADRLDFVFERKKIPKHALDALTFPANSISVHLKLTSWDYDQVVTCKDDAVERRLPVSNAEPRIPKWLNEMTVLTSI